MLRATLALVAACAVTFSSGSAWAQFPDLLEVGGRYLPPAAMDDPAGLGVQVSSYDAVVNVPVVLGARTFLVPGVEYHVDSVSFTDEPAGFIDLRAFHSVSVPVLFVRLLPRDWALSVRVAPALSGDFARVDAGLFHMSTVAMATRPFSEDLVFGFGGIGTYSFGSFMPLPALYVDWTPHRRVRFEAFVPAFAHLDLVFGDRLELGPSVRVSGNEYAVRDQRIRSHARCAHPTGDRTCMDHVAYSEVTANVEARVRMAGTWWLTARAGRTVHRRFEQLDVSDRRIDGGLHALESAWQAGLFLTWRLPIPDPPPGESY